MRRFNFYTRLSISWQKFVFGNSGFSISQRIRGIFSLWIGNDVYEVNAHGAIMTTQPIRAPQCEGKWAAVAVDHQAELAPKGSALRYRLQRDFAL